MNSSAKCGNCFTQVEFELINREKVNTEIYICPNYKKNKVGETVAIYYNPDKPQEAELAADKWFFLPSILFTSTPILVGLLLILMKAYQKPDGNVRLTLSKGT